MISLLMALAIASGPYPATCSLNDAPAETCLVATKVENETAVIGVGFPSFGGRMIIAGRVTGSNTFAVDAVKVNDEYSDNVRGQCLVQTKRIRCNIVLRDGQTYILTVE